MLLGRLSNHSVRLPGKKPSRDNWADRSATILNLCLRFCQRTGKAGPMISFELSDEQKMVRDTVAAFALEQIRPAARLADESGSIPPELLAKAWELGLVRGCLPENVGGYGDPRVAVTGAIVAEELAYGDLSFALHALAPRL